MAAPATPEAIPDGAVLGTIELAITEVAAGRPVVVVDDEDRENEGDLTLAAGHATPATVGLMIRYGSGVICAPMAAEDLERLALPPMAAVNQDPKGTAYTVSVDARTGCSTGISAADRARTLRVLADRGSGRDDLTRPGHVFPLRAVPDGVLRRPGHTEAAVDLARLAGLAPAAAICELANDDGSMMRLPELIRFARRHRLVIVSIADLIRYRLRHESHVRRVAQTRLPLTPGTFRAIGYRSTVTGYPTEILALVLGEAHGDGVLVHPHRECLPGDLFASTACACRRRLDDALGRIAAAGRGAVLHLRGPARIAGGPHSGLACAAERADPATRVRTHAAIRQVLTDLGVRSVRLLNADTPDDDLLGDLETG